MPIVAAVVRDRKREADLKLRRLAGVREPPQATNGSLLPKCRAERGTLRYHHLEGRMVGAVGLELEALSRRKRGAAGDEREPATEMPSGARHLALSPLRGSDGGAL